MNDRAKDRAAQVLTDGWYSAKWIAVYGQEQFKAGEAAGYRKGVEAVPMGRLWCDDCNSWDHNCGCRPNIIERKRTQLIAEQEEK